MINNLKNWFNRYRVHFWAWTIFILYECIIVRFFVGENGALMAYAVHYSIVIGYFYLHALFILPWALHYRPHAVWKLPLVIAAEVGAFVLTYFVADLGLNRIHVKLLYGQPHLNSEYININIYRSIYFFAFSTAYYYLKTFLNEKKRTEALERERLNEIIKRQKTEQELTRAQNAFLKAQINPHFLFNTLDFVYHNVMGSSPKAADAIVTLAEMMRYAIDADKMGEFILIGDEIEQVQNLQYLNRLRKNEDLPLKLIYSDEVRSINFIPLVLLTLTENIFKHGSLNAGQEAVMELYIEDNMFFIKTDNLSNRQRPGVSHRTGLINIEQRLKYAYGEIAHFDYHQDDDGHFRLTIKVPVQQLRGTSSPSPVLAGIETV